MWKTLNSLFPYYWSCLKISREQLLLLSLVVAWLWGQNFFLFSSKCCTRVIGQPRWIIELLSRMRPSLWQGYRNQRSKSAKVNIKCQGLKDMAPFHLLLIFENPNGFEMWKLTSKYIQSNANIIYTVADDWE